MNIICGFRGPRKVALFTFWTVLLEEADPRRERSATSDRAAGRRLGTVRRVFKSRGSCATSQETRGRREDALPVAHLGTTGTE